MALMSASCSLPLVNEQGGKISFLDFDIFGQYGKVPCVVDMTADDAEKVLGDKGYAMRIVDMVFDEKLTKDTIKYQMPEEGSSSKNCKDKDDEGRPVVSVIVSGGKPFAKVPDVSAMAKKDAVDKLKSLGFEVKTNEEYSDTTPKGTVMFQDVVNVECAYGCTIAITVSKGKLKADSSRKHKMPNFVGMTYDEALKKLNSMSMYVHKKEKASTKPDNCILKQSKKAGDYYAEGTTVVLTVSSGTIVIPNVVYKEVSAAKKLIETAGAKVTTTYEKNEQVKSGNVISQSIIGKTTRGKTVKLVVSSGSDHTESNIKNNVSNVEDLIDKIGAVEYQKATLRKIEKAEAAYAKLNPIEKKQVNNYAQLVSARNTYNAKEKAENEKVLVITDDDKIDVESQNNKKAAYEVICYIEAIGKVGADESTGTRIAQAENAYNNLTPTQKKLVDNHSLLLDARSKYDELVLLASVEKEKTSNSEDVKAVVNVMDEIYRIGAVSYNNTCKTKIDNAEKAYNALSDEQKKLVTNYAILTAAKATYAQKEEDSRNYVVVPEMIGRHVGTNYGNAYNQINRMYPELDGVSVQFHTKSDSSYSDGVICDMNPSPGSVITKKGSIDIYISRK